MLNVLTEKHKLLRGLGRLKFNKKDDTQQLEIDKVHDQMLHYKEHSTIETKVLK